MSDHATKRAETLERLNEALREDQRLAGTVLVGSGAYGFQDDDSDIDLVAPVATEFDPATVFEDWKERIRDVVAVRYRAETAFTEQHHLLVLLCDDTLEVDLSFPALRSLVALTPNWRVLWDRSGEVVHQMALPTAESFSAGKQAYIWTVNRAIHRAVYAAKALRRGQVWKALLLLDELRCRVVQLACLYTLGETTSDALGPKGVERYVDQLPPEVLAEFSRSLPRSVDGNVLRQSLVSYIEALLRHSAALDRRFKVEQSTGFMAVLRQHLSLATPSA